MKLMTKLKISLVLVLILALAYSVYSSNDRIATNLDQTAADAINDTSAAAKNATAKVVDDATAAIDNKTIEVINNYSDEHHAKTLAEIEAIKNGTNATGSDGTVAPVVHNATTPSEAMRDLTASVTKDEVSIGYTKIAKRVENETANYTASAIATRDGLIRK